MWYKNFCRNLFIVTMQGKKAIQVSKKIMQVKCRDKQSVHIQAINNQGGKIPIQLTSQKKAKKF